MAKKKNVTISNDTENDESSIYNEMTKGDKSILDFSEVKKEDVEIWYSTGSFILDTMITNSYRSQEGKLLGGVSGGKITLLSGLESTGKSMLAAHFIAEAQKKGAMCMYFDTEQRLNQTFFRDMGVDFSTNKLILSDERVIQKVFAKIEKFILTIKESKNPKRPAIVVIDSIAGSTTLQEEDEKFEDPSFGTLAKEVSRGLRKIAGMLNGNNVHLVLTNQLRFNMNKANKYADDYVDITGAALKFWNSLHFRLVKPSKADRIFNKKNQQIGVLTKLKFNKNSYGCPQPDVELPLYYGRGIDEDLNWLNFFKEKNYVVVRGQSATIKIPTLPEEKIELKSWKVWLHSDNDRYEKLKEIIANEIYVDLYSDDFTEEVYELSDDDKVDNTLQPTTVVNSVEEIPMMN